MQRRTGLIGAVVAVLVAGALAAGPASAGGGGGGGGNNDGEDRPRRTTTTTAEQPTTTTTAEPRTTTTTGNAPGEGDDLPGDVANRLDGVAREVLSEYEVPGAVVGVFTPQGEFVRTYGFANVNSGRRVDVDDRFGIRSVTKSFVVTALLKLVDDGELELSDPIAEYVDNVPSGDLITLAELAEMRSGIFDFTESPEFQAALAEDLGRTFTDEELIGFATSQPLEFAPGTQYEYSNTNTVLIGMAIEKATGDPLGEVIGRLVLRPLGLRDTTYAPGRPFPEPRAFPYDVDPETGEVERVDALDLTTFGAAGAMVSTLGDMRKWGDAMVGSALLEKSTQWQRIASPGAATTGPVYDRYGVGIGEIDGWWGHHGESIGYQAAVFHQPYTDATIVVLTNSSPPVNVAETVFVGLADVLD